MSHQPTTEVVFAFDQGAGGTTNFFTLDDAVAGVLDNTTYTLGGDFSLVDVTQYVRSLRVSRGRSRILDKTQAASAEIVLDNRARLFDPTAGTAVSPYASSILPRKNVQIKVNDEPIFSGQVDDWNIDFDVSGDSTTTAVCADGFSLLGQVLMGTATRSAESSGTRIDAVLTEAAWPTAKRDIDTGQVTLQADTPAENTNVLDYIQTVTQTEFGAFYMDRVGLATFEDRLATQNFGSAVVLGGTGVPIVGVQIDYGTEQLYNQITVSRENGGTAVRSDSTSQTAYGINELSQSGLLFDDDTELGELGDYLLSKFKDPTFRIQQVDIRMGGLGTADQSLVAGLEIADPVQVTFTPSVGSAVTQYATIDRIEHSVLPSEHVVTLSMSQAQPSFILSDAVFGELDDDRLGF